MRAAREGERDALFRVYSDPRAMAFWDTPPHRAPDDTQWLYDSLRQSGKRLYFVWDMSGRIIGTGGIHSGTELGFIMHSDHWGQGLAREAVSAILEHVWDTTDFAEVTTDVDPRNLASVGLLTRLGFRVTGFQQDTICVEGRWFDSVYLALPRPRPS